VKGEWFMKRVLKVIGIIVVLLIVIVIALPFLINVNTFRPKLEGDLSAALGRDVKVGNLSLSLLSGSVAAEKLSIADDPAFSKAPFVQAKSLKVGVELLPLILSKQIRVTHLTLAQPEIVLLKSSSGKWNFSSLGKNAHGAAAPSPPATAPANAPAPAQKPAESTGAAAKPGEPITQNLSVAKLNVTDGRLSLGKANSPTKPHVYDNVNISVRDFSFTSQFPFTLTSNLPGGGNMKLDGKAGPINPEDAAATPVQAKLDVKRLDLAASGFVDPSAGIAGIADLDATLDSDGHSARSQGTVNADKLKLSEKGSPAARPVQVKYASEYNLDKQSGTLTQADVAIGQALAHLTGTYEIKDDNTLLNMKLNAPNMAVNDLVAMLPALGVVLPSGSTLQGGTLSTTLAIAGSVAKPVITGPIKLADTKLAGFNLGSKMSAIGALSGAKTGNDTVIQNLSTDAHVAPTGITTDNVNLNVPALGTVTGNGSIAPGGALNYHLVANLAGAAVSGLSQLAGMGGKGASIPFFIQGTTSDPKFVPDVKGLVGSQLENQLKGGLPANANPNANQAIDALGGLLGKKKKKQ
jgi:AsmA protein